jgi:glutathione S-transferase
MAQTVLYNLQPSPNSKKVRLALGFKGIPYETVQVDPMDRATVVKVSGQPLTPVLTHGSTVIFDSSAILRYLEANVAREPRIFSEDYETMQAIEKWEGYARTELSRPVGALFGQFFAESVDEAVVATANASFNDAARQLQKSLNSDGWLVGKSPTAADISCASWFGLALLSPEQASSHPIYGFFSENLQLDAELQRLRGWYRSIDKYDT